MGFGFPTGMRLITAVDRKPTPWFWGINGASGVLASAAAVGCSIAYGVGTTLTLGAVCYFLLIPAALIIGFPNVLRKTAVESVFVPLEIDRSNELPNSSSPIKRV